MKVQEFLSLLASVKKTAKGKTPSPPIANKSFETIAKLLPEPERLAT